MNKVHSISMSLSSSWKRICLWFTNSLPHLFSESIIRINMALWRGVHLRAAYINTSALKCGVYLRVVFNQINAVFHKVNLVHSISGRIFRFWEFFHILSMITSHTCCSNYFPTFLPLEPNHKDIPDLFFTLNNFLWGYWGLADIIILITWIIGTYSFFQSVFWGYGVYKHFSHCCQSDKRFLTFVF